MLAEVRLSITATEARLTFSAKGASAEDELWSFQRTLGPSETLEFARAVFDNAYDAMNLMANGDYE